LDCCIARSVVSRLLSSLLSVRVSRAPSWRSELGRRSDLGRRPGRSPGRSPARNAADRRRVAVESSGRVYDRPPQPVRDGWPALVADLLVAPRGEAPPLCLPTRAGGEAHVLGDLRRAPREALKLALIMIDDSHQILHEALQHAKSLVCLLVLQVGGGS